MISKAVAGTLVGLSLSAATSAQQAVEEVVVTATPLEREALEMTQAATVLHGDELADELANTIGETVGSTPGVHSAFFGAGVGRPIIRGLDGSRVGVLENNVSSNDVSNVSADHAVTIEPFLAEQVEVLRGPATLLYGSDTIGGAVNVRTNRIPDRQTDGLEGRLELRGDSVADEWFGAVGLDYGEGRLGLHADAFARETNDYEIPQSAGTGGALPNSAVETRGGAFGLSYLGDRGQAGVSFSRYDNRYGIPTVGAGEDEELVDIEIDQDKLDLQGRLGDPLPGFDQLKVYVSQSDYTHTEFEGEETGTTFNSDSLDGRLELTHVPLSGWRGVVGAQWTNRDFEAIGEEAFVPPSETDEMAVFLLEERDFGDVRLEFGGRYEEVDIQTASGRARFEPISLSTGAIWHFSQTTHLAFNLARAERAPAEEELFADGPHIANQTFELGDANLGKERATNIDLSLRKHDGPLTGAITVFRNRFSDYIYLADTGLEEEGFPVRRWSQQDANFHGVEVELGYTLGAFDHGTYSVHGFADRVDAELADGTHVPRTPPGRVGLGLDWEQAAWRAGFDVVRYARQDDVAPLESPTPGYTLLSADLVYSATGANGNEWEIYLRGRNLGDEEARSHTSLLRDVAPLPGRNLVLGFRARF